MRLPCEFGPQVFEIQGHVAVRNATHLWYLFDLVCYRSNIGCTGPLDKNPVANVPVHAGGVRSACTVRISRMARDQAEIFAPRESVVLCHYVSFDRRSIEERIGCQK